MSLIHARSLPGEDALPALSGEPPFSGSVLEDWKGRRFVLPAGDPRLEEIHNGGPAPTPPLDNLVGATRYWEEHPDWMRFLEPSSPSHQDKMVELALYLDRWEGYLSPGQRVLDLGGGVGRFMTWLLDRGCEVELVDPDLRSIWSAVSSAAGRAGSLDVHWSTGESMPEIEPVDVVIAAEVLCYVEEPARVMKQILRHLRPGGILLMSVEARWGWALASDVHEGTLEAFLGDGVVHAPGDRWVRTFTEESMRSLLSGLEIQEVVPSHFAFSGPFENIVGTLDPERALHVESLLRAHPLAGKLNRAWMAVARQPGRIKS
jgi:SAM-dependent methyltransferase